MDTLTKKVALGILRERKSLFAEIEEQRIAAYNRRENFPYCQHGTFIGDPYGPDYMCGECEMGESEDERLIAIHRAKKTVKDYTDGIVLLSQIRRMVDESDNETFDALLTLRRAIRTNTIGRYEK